MRHRNRRDDFNENHERWLVSYADFVTLLFAFFVVMYAVSSVNEGKYRVLSDSLVAAFRNVAVNTRSTDLAAAQAVPSLPRSASVRKSSRDAKAESARRQAREKMRSIAGRIADILGPLVKEGRVKVMETSVGVTVEINASVLFAPGDARLDPRAERTLRAVAEVLAVADLPVTVEGHTDTTPISTPQFPSNWELSVVRASSVVRLFVDAGMSPQKLAATGYGEQRPVADNDTAEGRGRNRRVAILIEAPTVNEVPAEIPIATGSGVVGASSPRG